MARTASPFGPMRQKAGVSFYVTTAANMETQNLFLVRGGTEDCLPLICHGGTRPANSRYIDRIFLGGKK
jgi:hypothetical protein